MFTGIITDVGRILAISEDDGRRMTIATRLPLAEIPWPPLKGQPLKERFGVLEPLPKFEVPADMPVVEHKDNWD